jgi:hypothetical protein
MVNCKVVHDHVNYHQIGPRDTVETGRLDRMNTAMSAKEAYEPTNITLIIFAYWKF